MKRILPILIASLVLWLNPLKAEAEEPKEEYLDYINEICEDYSICPEFVEALIFYESSWDTEATSKGCIGLCQINESVHKKRIKELGVTDLKDPYQNILVSVDYLSELFEEYEDPALVLDAYNGNLQSMSFYEAGKLTRYSKKILTLSAEMERKDGK